MDGPRYSNGHEAVGIPSRQRPSFSSMRTGSTATTLTSDMVLEQNNTEPYAGATFETVPSSIVSFHHPHSLQSSNLLGSSISPSAAGLRGRRSTEEEYLIRSPTRSRSSSHNRHFKFFTEDQITNAEGASTLEHTDYDTHWDSVPAYEQHRLQDFRFGSQRSSLLSRSPRSSFSNGSYYGSLRERGRSLSRSSKQRPHRELPIETYSPSVYSSASPSRYSLRDRVPSEVEDRADGSLDERSEIGRAHV